MNHSAKAVVTIVTIVGAVCLAVLIGGVVLSTVPPLPEGKVNREFVCYTDDKLSERHVGVARVVVSGAGDGGWTIDYVDGGRVRYLQIPGESCGLESYNANQTKR